MGAIAIVAVVDSGYRRSAKRLSCNPEVQVELLEPVRTPRIPHTALDMDEVRAAGDAIRSCNVGVIGGVDDARVQSACNRYESSPVFKGFSCGRQPGNSSALFFTNKARHAAYRQRRAWQQVLRESSPLPHRPQSAVAT